ncbi:MAG: hypothetical protein IRY99_27735 [Isosphaeraceae bacterium]|nr:hypothetical protein [Isosphaeraceae bacterium]
MRVAFRIFAEVFGSWESRCERAAEFASGLAPGRLLTISCTEVGVIVWYWEEGHRPADASAEPGAAPDPAAR